MICKDDYFRQELPFASRLNIPTFECTQEGVNSLVRYLRREYCSHIVYAYLNEKGTVSVAVDPIKMQIWEGEWLKEVFQWCLIGVRPVVVIDEIVAGSFKVGYV